MKISITCAANGNNKQPLLFWTIRREHARGRDQSLEWLFRLKGLCKAGVMEVYFPPRPSMQKGKQGFDCFQANQAVLMTLLPFSVHPLVCCVHIGECSLCWTLCLGEHAPPAWPKSTSSIEHGRKKNKNSEGGPEHPLWRAQQVTGWHGSDATSTRKEAFCHSFLWVYQEDY